MTDPDHMSVEMAELFGLVCKMNRLKGQRDDLMRTDGGFSVIERAADMMDEIVDSVPELKAVFAKVHAREASYRVASASTSSALREALEQPWNWPCPAGDDHCCCDCEECCDCERPRFVKPDWLNAETCIENVMEALSSDTLFSEDGPVDTMVSSGDLMVILSLAGAAFHAHRALSGDPTEKETTSC